MTILFKIINCQIIFYQVSFLLSITKWYLKINSLKFLSVHRDHFYLIIQISLQDRLLKNLYDSLEELYRDIKIIFFTLFQITSFFFHLAYIMNLMCIMLFLLGKLISICLILQAREKFLHRPYTNNVCILKKSLFYYVFYAI